MQALRAGDAQVEADGLGTVPLSADDVIVTERPQRLGGGERHGETVALDLTVTPELRRAGLVREAVRLVQEARKAAGLEVTDRIELWWEATGTDLAEALHARGGGRRRGPRDRGERGPTRGPARDPRRGPRAHLLPPQGVRLSAAPGRSSARTKPRPGESGRGGELFRNGGSSRHISFAMMVR